MNIKHIILCIEFVFLAVRIVTSVAAKESPLRHKNLLKGINLLAFITIWICFIAIIVLNIIGRGGLNAQNNESKQIR